MELDWPVTFVVAASALFSARVAFRSRAYRWLAVQGLNLLVLGLAWLFARGHVALVVGPVWAITVLAPSLATNFAERYARAERFRLSRALARVAAALHPNPTTRLRVAVADVQVLEQDGRVEAARAKLDELLAREPGAFVLASLLKMRLDQQWGEIREWLEARRELLEAEPVAISFYMRALGELGDVEGLAAAYTRAARSVAAVAVEGQTMLFVAAFGGREAATSAVLRASHAEMPDDGKRLWLLTAARAAGRDVDADLAALARTARPRVAAVAKRRLEAPRPAPLSDEAKGVLDEIERVSATLEPALAPRPSACWAIAAVNLYAFLREIPGGTTSAVNLHALGALYTGDIEASEWYRLATATLLHYGVAHVAMNVLGLLVLGSRLEAAIGRVRLVVVYVTSGFAANALAVLWTRHGGGAPALLVGASGAVMGVAGALLVRRVLRWRQRRTLLARREVVSLVSMFVLQIGFDAVTPHVAGDVHLFGAGVGALVALAIAWPRAAPVALPSARRARVVMFFSVAVAIALLEFAWRRAARDASPNGECAEGDVPACASDCEALLGSALLDGGAPERPRFSGRRGAYMLQSCNRLAFALSNPTDAGLSAGPDAIARARALYTATCDAGSLLGCTNLGVMMENGEAGPPDPAAAERLFGEACDAGHARACTYLGDTLRRRGGSVDLARELFVRACDAGDAPGCSEMKRLEGR